MNENEQKPLDETTEVATEAVKYDDLSPAQKEWVDYNAVQGVLTANDGTMVKMSIDDFAARIGYGRTTLWKWQKNIPGFWDMVNQRRSIIGSQTRTQKVWNAVFINATTKLNPKSQEMWLANHDKNYRSPTQKVQIEDGGGILELLAMHRQRLHTEAIEGEVGEKVKQIGAANEPTNHA